MLAKLIDRVRKGPAHRYRSAETGEFVSWIFAKLHPKTTVRERVR